MNTEPPEFDPPCKCAIRNSRLKQGVIGPHHAPSCPQYGGVRPENEPQRMARRIAAPQPVSGDAPKVEEWPNCDYTNRPCLDVSQVCRCEKCQEWAKTILRPYFPPASQKDDLSAENDRLSRLLQHIADTVGLLPSVTGLSAAAVKDHSVIWMAIRDLQECYKDAARARNGLYTKIEKRWNEIATFLDEQGIPAFEPLQLNEPALAYTTLERVKLLATPASTARTDGWVSVEESLPKVNKHVEILMSDASVAVNDIPCIGYLVSDGTWWCGIPGHYFHCPQLRWTVTGWRELPAAPGSVPQAAKAILTELGDALGLNLEAYTERVSAILATSESEYSCSLCGDNRDTPCAHHPHSESVTSVKAGVPQAEPPKEEKP